jgi:hypothetical protein
MTTLEHDGPKPEWAEKAPDRIIEGENSITHAIEIAGARRERSEEVPFKLPAGPDCVSAALDGEIHLRLPNPEGRRFRDLLVRQISNWAFSDLCGEANAPANYLSRLSVKTVTACLSEGLAAPDAKTLLALIEREPTFNRLRAVTDLKYTRIWDVEVLRFADALTEKLGCAPVRVTQNDRELHVWIRQPGSNAGVHVWNSEVGAKAGGFAHCVFPADGRASDLNAVLRFRDIVGGPDRWVRAALDLLEKSFDTHEPEALESAYSAAGK